MEKRLRTTDATRTRNESEAYIMNVSITVQGVAKVCRGDFPVGKIPRL